MNKFSFLLLIVATSCCRLAPLPVCSQFDGVQDSLNDKRVVSMVITHGMGGYSEGDPNDLICSLAHELGLERITEPQSRKVVCEDSDREYGCLERRDYCNPECNWEVRFYLLDWRKATWSEKSVLRDIDEESDLICMQASWNNKWRKQLLTDVVADVNLYLGEHDKQIRYPFKQAIRWIKEDGDQIADHDIFVVAFSLGSGIFLDTLAEMNHCEDPTEKESRDWFLANIRSFFMMSNQLPLIELNRMRPHSEQFRYDDDAPCNYCTSCSTHNQLSTECKPRGINWDCTSLGDFVLDKKQQDPDFQVINFTDPNDLLSFILYTSRVPYCSCGARGENLIQNVLVRNSKRAWFGRLANPAKAHQDYGENPYVLGMIADGMQYDEKR